MSLLPQSARLQIEKNTERKDNLQLIFCILIVNGILFPVIHTYALTRAHKNVMTRIEEKQKFGENTRKRMTTIHPLILFPNR